MDKRILAALAFVAISGIAQAAGTALCTGTAGNGVTVAGETDGTAFVRVDLVPKCSANVQLSFDQNTTSAGVCANSTKGKNTYSGTTEGGAVSVAAPCTVTSGACEAPEATLSTDATTGVTTNACS